MRMDVKRRLRVALSSATRTLYQALEWNGHSNFKEGGPFRAFPLWSSNGLGAVIWGDLEIEV